MQSTENNKPSKDQPGGESSAAPIDKEQAGEFVAGTPDHHRSPEPAPGVAELQDQLLRALADAENARKRADRAKWEGRMAGIADVTSGLLPALDSLDLAINASRDVSQQDPDRMASFFNGLMATQREFLGTLERFGVRRINPIGESFDAVFHEAVATRSEPDTPPRQVLDVMQCGYAIGDRLVRPARVVVSAEPPP